MSQRNAKDIFEKVLPSKIATHSGFLADAGIRDKTVAVQVDGAGGGRWAFRFDSQGVVAMAGSGDAADCTISTKEDTFQGLLDGKVNVMTAVLFGKIKVAGDKGLAAKLGGALKKVFA